MRGRTTKDDRKRGQADMEAAVPFLLRRALPSSGPWHAQTYAANGRGPATADHRLLWADHLPPGPGHAPLMGRAAHPCT